MVDINRHLGLETENRFFYAMASLSQDLCPAWFLGIREASGSEDTLGYDGFAKLDIGTVALQIKSSLVGAKKYLEQYPNHRILVVVVSPDSNESEIRAAVLEALEEWRASLLASMPKWKPQWTSLFSQKTHS